MAEKSLVFEDKDQIYVESICIDKDKEEAYKFVKELHERLKEHPGYACGFRTRGFK